MSHISSKRIPERAHYNLELITPQTPNVPYMVQAKLTATSTYQFGVDSDAKFNLSSMLGNDNGSFVWGRAAFEKSGNSFELNSELATGAFILTGKLIDLAGVEKEARINLDERLKIVEYVDKSSWDTFHKLAERNATAPPRTLVLCFDGTSNHFSDKNTNVVKFVELLKKNDPNRQMVYYQTGVGTYSPPGLLTPVGLWTAEKADEAAAWYLYQHVIDGYKYLMQTYRLGDSVSIFGFSRGAFTARALAGMIHCVGLLPRHNIEHIPFAYEVYKHAADYHTKPPPPDTSALGFGKVEYGEVTAPDPTTGSRPQDVNPEEFKRTFCTPLIIDFVGVWDTVASVGALYSQTLPWIGYNPSIANFRQALALDERRGNFIPSVWDHRYTNIFTQKAVEVWFRGEHCDIGGGSAAPTPDPKKPDRKDHSMLSNITLRWMVRQCIDSRTGILFDYTAIEAYRKKGVLGRPAANHALGDARARVEASLVLDKADMMHDMYDSIGWSALWNPLEIMPVSKPTKTKELKPDSTRWPNLKTGRSIYARDSDPIYLHSSVVEYMMSDRGKKEKYQPRAIWQGRKKEWPRVEDPSEANYMLPDWVGEKLTIPEGPGKVEAQPKKWYFF
ncbi:hypothetical protein BDV93DRAFT_608367 [Ceratobasidium sp. AG-I]|nr:hypothetical protein BDV93DRAFT_608367 [Ceratobasidium sp. AG-I]